MLSKKNIFIIVLTLIAIQVAVSVFGAVFVSVPGYSDRILPGVMVEGINLGGLNKNEAVTKLTRAVDPGLYNSTVKLSHNAFQRKISYSDLGIRPDYNRAVEMALLKGRENNPLLRMFTKFKLRRQQVNIAITLEIDRDTSKTILNDLAQEIDKKPRNASVELKGDKLMVTPEEKGRQLQIAQSIEALQKAVANGKQESQLVVREVTPEITTAQLEQIKEDMALSVTEFNDNEKARVRNIAKAAEYINNTLLQAGEVFSFNQRVGLRKRERGFESAPVITNRKLSEAVGGGVCQVSTTLYMAALLAGLEITERHPHSLPPGYVPIGQDAAVADDQLDLKIRNNSGAPILVIAYVEKDKLIVRIMGKQGPFGEVNLVSEIIQVLEPKVVIKEDGNLAKGVNRVITQGQKGYRVKVFREFVGDINSPERELISQDTYNSKNTIVKIGTKDNKYIKKRK